ncbi:tRNA pseudouridine(38-40) synthase TruA [Allisonella histaminiformans]|uniref:tRNA pseudouridine(38-40) synthase TruA n=1 Tax=Allisonella histaminiformans TaxID=209880 RepID=UPI0026EB7EDF|nr:tRNA pseudouridine(38-40) synthase TruA [Allisonella histaminiformans]
MKRNIWITVSYEGTAYAGFQRQPVAMTVQKAIEEALLQITGVSTTLYFVARTDAGVHAWGQECTFYTESRVPGDKFKYALNAILPRDIRVRESREAAEDFSVRRMNYGKTYAYNIWQDRDISPFMRRYAWVLGRELNVEKMRAAAAVLVGRHDFTSFRGNNSVPSDPVRNLMDIRVEPEGRLIRIYVTGEGFLYHMVRNIAGALADAGQGKLSPEDLVNILKARDRRKLGVTAPAEGLCLLQVYFEPITGESIDKTVEESVMPWGMTAR